MSDETIVWSEPVGPLRISDEETHVWRTTLDWPATGVDALSRTLSAEELARVDRLHRQTDRLRAIVGRGLLRLLLSHYLASSPDDVRLTCGPQGKPKLADGPASQRLGFNLSHSGDLILVAISYGPAVGIDVERIRGDIDWNKIVMRRFSAREASELASLSPEERIDAFYSCWTRKEAYIKAREDGLSLPLDQFDVAVLPGRPAMLLDSRHAPGEHLLWTLRDLDVGEGYKAALAVEGAIGRLRCWDWPAGRTSVSCLLA